MHVRSAEEIKKSFLDDQSEMAKLLDAGNVKGFWTKLVQGSENALAQMLDLSFEGKKVRDVTEYKEAKKLTDKLFEKVWKIYWGVAPFPLQALMDFDDAEYAISILQGMDVVGLFKEGKESMDNRVRAWFILGLYAFEYELSAKAILSYANVLTAKGAHTKPGEVVNLLKNRYRVVELGDYFEPFLRNAIDHSQYIVTDERFGTVDAWNVVKGRKTSVNRYDIGLVFKMTERLVFFMLAYLCTWYELVIELNKRGAYR
jgi:hypothetical protein